MGYLIQCHCISDVEREREKRKKKQRVRERNVVRTRIRIRICNKSDNEKEKGQGLRVCVQARLSAGARTRRWLACLQAFPFPFSRPNPPSSPDESQRLAAAA